MIHAANIAMELHAMLPAHMRAEHTEGYDGFFHCMSQRECGFCKDDVYCARP